MKLANIVRFVWTMIPVLLIIWWITLLWNKLWDKDKGNFITQTFVWSDNNTESDNIEIETDNITWCPVLSIKGDQNIDYTWYDTGWVYNIPWWDYEISCDPKSWQNNNIMIRSENNSSSDIILNPSIYTFYSDKWPYKWVCISHPSCSRDINVR